MLVRWGKWQISSWQQEDWRAHLLKDIAQRNPMHPMQETRGRRSLGDWEAAGIWNGQVYSPGFTRIVSNIESEGSVIVVLTTLMLLRGPLQPNMQSHIKKQSGPRKQNTAPFGGGFHDVPPERVTITGQVGEPPWWRWSRFFCALL